MSATNVHHAAGLRFRMVVHRRISALRRERGMTWAELSRRSGVSARRLSKPTRFTVEDLVTTADALGVDPVDMFKAASELEQNGAGR